MSKFTSSLSFDQPAWAVGYKPDSLYCIYPATIAETREEAISLFCTLLFGELSSAWQGLQAKGYAVVPISVTERIVIDE